MATKKSSERLQVVLRLAQIKQQQAAERLAQAALALQNNQNQGQQLRLYQEEYNLHFHDFEQRSLSSQQMRNYQRFYGGLEEAVYTQDQRSNISATQFEFHRAHWQKTYGREKNMEKLVANKLQAETKMLDNKQQAEVDDRSNAYRLRKTD